MNEKINGRSRNAEFVVSILFYVILLDWAMRICGRNTIEKKRRVIWDVRTWADNKLYEI